ncbi:hypothetical protein ACLGI4_28930 [Streptomyces sp. HMX112]|uniref:hypothetical protein n=1 Tax=Streptomyces sp. HMX112 TaxID=3390850 RepID=UPI003A800598
MGAAGGALERGSETTVGVVQDVLGERAGGAALGRAAGGAAYVVGHGAGGAGEQEGGLLVVRGLEAGFAHARTALTRHW